MKQIERSEIPDSFDVDSVINEIASIEGILSADYDCAIYYPGHDLILVWFSFVAMVKGKPRVLKSYATPGFSKPGDLRKGIETYLERENATMARVG